VATASYTTVVPGVGSFSIQGAGELMARLRGLEPKLRKRVARRAVRAGATIWRDAAMRYAAEFDDPDTPRKVSRNIAIRESARGGRAAGGIHVRVGVLGGAKRKFVGPPTPKHLRKRKRKAVDPRDVYYWRFLEFGTRKTRARPFLRPAYNQNIDTATTAVANELNAGIDRLLAGTP
jgi:HK97 gp10 family phage protein